MTLDTLSMLAWWPVGVLPGAIAARFLPRRGDRPPDRRRIDVREQIGPIEAFVGHHARYVARIETVLSARGADAEYTPEVSRRAQRARNEMLDKLLQSAADAGSAAERIDRDLFRRVRDASGEGALLARDVTTAPREQGVRLLFERVRKARRANERLAARVREVRA